MATDTDLSLVDQATGEVMDKPYLTTQHNGIAKVILEQWRYVHKTLRDEKDPDAFARLSGDVLSMLMIELAGMYESLSKWLADEKLHIADLKTALDFKFADEYIAYKSRRSETNETARMRAKMACNKDEVHLNQVKHDYDRVEVWKKSVGRYHDSVRSQLSYEKQLSMMGGGQ